MSMSGLDRMGQMATAEMMMDLATALNDRTGFATGVENYASAAWDKLGRFEYDELTALMQSYRTCKDEFWGDLYRTVFPS